MVPFTQVPRLKEKSLNFSNHHSYKFDQIARQYLMITLIVAVYCINCVHSYKSDHIHQHWRDKKDDSILNDVSKYYTCVHLISSDE